MSGSGAADHLTQASLRLRTGAPIWEIAGPQEESLVRLAMLFTAKRGDPVRIEGMSNPADPDRDLYESGAMLPGPQAIRAGPTFEAWLASTSDVIE